MASGMFGEAKNAKKDILADLITAKHDLQACIQEVSLNKARIADSESKVKADMQHIYTKLQKMLKKMVEGATHAASIAAQAERIRLNENIIALEEEYKSVEEMEENIKENASNTNLKPLKEGKDKCEEAREFINNQRASSVPQQLQFVLQPLLAYLLRQLDAFNMGEVKVMSLQDEMDAQEALDTVADSPEKKSNDPERTTFMRSNSSKLIQLSSRSNSTLSTKSTKSKMGRSKSSLRTDTNTVPLPKQDNRPSLLITKRNTKAKTDLIPKQEQPVTAMDDPEQLIPMSGLSATLAVRSTSAPLINALSKQNGTASEKTRTVELSSPLELNQSGAFTTTKHKTSCFITGIVALANGNIVLCDNVHDSVQMFDAELNNISEVELTHPWGVTAVSDAAVAVSLNFDKKISLMKAETTLERLTDKEISLKCEASMLFDVKYNSYRLYCLCSDGDVHVIDLKGRQFSCIKTGIPNGVQKHLEINEDAKCLYASGEKGIVCLTLENIPLWHFRTISKITFTPTGIVLFQGSVLVLDWENNSVVEILKEGVKIRTICTSGLEKPVTICKTSDGKRLLVTQGDYDMSADKSRAVKTFSTGVVKKTEEIEKEK